MRGQTLLVALGALLLAACSSAPAAQSPGSAATATSLAATSAAADAPATRAITHALGQANVPLNPQRIVSLAPGEITDTLIALNRKPIGSLTYDGSASASGYPAALADQIDGIAAVGNAGEPNLEQIAALKPDLIIGPQWLVTDLYQQLSAIAPTVATSDARDFRVWLAEIGRAVGAENEVARVLDGYQARIATLRPQLASRQVSIVRPRSDSLLIYGAASGPGIVLSELGLEVQELPVEAEDWGGDGLRAIGQVSLEWVPNIVGEHVFVITYNLEDITFEQLIQQPLWQRLPAAQNGNIHPVEGIAWTNHGPLGVLRMLDEVAAALLGNDAASAGHKP
jgi:iron complex transport system substrate-binding protein